MNQLNIAKIVVQTRGNNQFQMLAQDNALRLAITNKIQIGLVKNVMKSVNLVQV